MKKLIKLLFILFHLLGISQNNLLSTATWMEGSGSVAGFTAYGTNSENTRLLGTTPFGDQEVIWIGSSEGDTSDADGGFTTDYIGIDHTKTYRFSVWMKKSGSFDGNAVFKVNIYDVNSGLVALKLDGTEATNPIFQSSDVPSLDKWYLYVGFVHGSGYSGTTSQGGVYDPTNGAMILNCTDYKFSATASKVRHLASLWSSHNITDALQFYGPSVYEVNGQEPTIEELLNPNVDNGGNNNLWSTNNDNIFYNSGNVGIGTTDPGTWKLAVNGNIRAKEIKVETANWPDYVFTKDHKLPTLQEVERHIQEKGHLMNIPSAEEVKTNGIELGEMNRLLLEKVEELTLYILSQNVNYIKQNQNIEELKKDVLRLQHIIGKKN